MAGPKQRKKLTGIKLARKRQPTGRLLADVLRKSKKDTSGGSPAQRTKKKKKKSIDLTPMVVRVAKAVGEHLEKTARPRNIARRKEFLKKQGLTSDDIRMDDDYLASKEGLKELRKIGYKTASDKTGGDGPPGETIGEPILGSESQVQKLAVKNAPSGPTISELAQLTEKERLLNIKRKGRKSTKIKRASLDDQLTLSKKTLLG